MATSGSVDFALTSRQICTAALQLIGATAQGEDPSAEDAATALLHLNLMLKTWGTDAKIFLLAETLQALTLSQATYTLAAARRVTEVRRRLSSMDTPMGELTRTDYFSMPNKTATGTPVSWYFDAQRSTRTLYVWPTPDTNAAANITLRYTYQRVIEDADALDNDPDVPQEWLEALTYSLAARLVLPFKTHIADPQGAAMVQQRAVDLYGQLEAQDQDGASVYMQAAI